MEKEKIQVADVEQNQVPQEGCSVQESNWGLSLRNNPLAQPTDDNGVPCAEKPYMYDTSQSRNGSQRKDTLHQNADSSEHHQLPIEGEEKIPDKTEKDMPPDKDITTYSTPSDVNNVGNSHPEPKDKNSPSIGHNNGQDFTKVHVHSEDPTPLRKEIAINYSLNTTENVSSQAKGFMGISKDKQTENVPDVNAEDFQEPENNENNGIENNDQFGMNGRFKEEEKLDDELLPKEILDDRANRDLPGENSKSPTKSVQGICLERQVVAHDLSKIENLDDQNFGVRLLGVTVPSQDDFQTVMLHYSKNKLDNLKNLEPGDIIFVKRFRGAYSHYMIYLGNVTGQDNGDDYIGDVVHLTGRVCDLMCCIKPEVKRENLKDVITPGSHIFVERGAWNGRRPLSAQEVIDRACSCIGRKGFNLIGNNCESFARLCKYDLAHSTQAQKCLYLITCGILKPPRKSQPTTPIKSSPEETQVGWSYENNAYQEI